MSNIDTLREQAENYYSNGDFRNALTAIEKAIQIEPDDATLYCKRGLCWLNQGIMDLAYRDFNEAICRCQSPDPDWLIHRGTAANALGERLIFFAKKYFRQAITDFETACRLKPRDSVCHHGLGYSRHNLAKRSWWRQAGFRQAIQHYTDALLFDPENTKIYVHRADAYLRLKEYEQVIADCTEAIQRDASNIAAFSLRMEAYTNTGQIPEAYQDKVQIANLYEECHARCEAKKPLHERFERKKNIPY